MIAHLIGHSLFCAPNIEVLPFICDRSVYFYTFIVLKKKNYKIFYLKDLFFGICLLLEMITGHETGRRFEKGLPNTD